MNDKWLAQMRLLELSGEAALEVLKEYNTAMANCQGEINSIGKNSEGGSAGYRIWKYADWPTIRDATRPILKAHGLSCLMWHEKREDGIYILSEIKHSSGYEELRESPMIFNIPESQAKPEHIVCGAITYYKRYVYNGLFGIATEEEDSEKQNYLDRKDNDNYDSNQPKKSITPKDPSKPITDGQIRLFNIKAKEKPTTAKNILTGFEVDTPNELTMGQFSKILDLFNESPEK